MKIKGICFEGGGICGIAYIGALYELQSHDMLKDITHFIGSSIGSIFALLLSCKIDISEIYKLFINLDLTKFEDSSYFILKDIYRFNTQFGWNSGNNFDALLSDILNKYVGTNILTFEEINKRFGNTLIITATDMKKRKTVYFSPLSTPNMDVKLAIRCSISLPLFYSPVYLNDTFYIDGGFLDNYPIKELYKYVKKEEVIGLKLVNNKNECEHEHELPRNIIEYIKLLILMMRDNQLKINNDEIDRTIFIDVGNVSAIDFNITVDKKEELMLQGKLAVLQFLNK
ncbi:MAG: patatin-like phospholipase family protein [Candidatus Micrarchaeaceae archaeon]